MKMKEKFWDETLSCNGIRHIFLNDEYYKYIGRYGYLYWCSKDILLQIDSSDHKLFYFQ